MNPRRKAGSITLNGEHNQALHERARELRRVDTPAEAALWAVLRGRRVDGWKFRRQCVLGPFIADFYCADLRLIVEVDGRVHDELDVRAHDAARDAWLRERGMRVLRIPAHLLLRDPVAAVARIEAAASVDGLSSATPSVADAGNVL